MEAAAQTETAVLTRVVQAGLHRSEHAHWHKPADPAKQASRMVEVCTRCFKTLRTIRCRIAVSLPFEPCDVTLHYPVLLLSSEATLALAPRVPGLLLSSQ